MQDFVLIMSVTTWISASLAVLPRVHRAEDVSALI